MRPCFVYIIAIEGQDLCKVGISQSPRSRLAQLQTGSPFKMRIVCQLETPDAEHARALEGAFHQVLRKRRTSGEWFAVPPHEAVVAMASNFGAFFERAMGLSATDAAELMAAAGVPDWAAETWFNRDGGSIQ